MPLTTTGPRLMPTRSSSLYAVSTVSLTGVSSGRVTSITWQRAGSDSSSTTSAAWVRIGPTRAASSSPWALVRKVMAWPAAGASTTITSGPPGPLQLLDLAQHQDVPNARNGRGHHVQRTRVDQPLGDPPQAVVDQVLEQGVVGGEGPGPDLRHRPAVLGPAPAGLRTTSS